MKEAESRMEADSKKLLRRWKRIAAVAIVLAGLLLAALVAARVFFWRQPRQTDERLIGTWQSDADRTIDEIRARRPVDQEQEAALRKIFGKLRVTYTETSYTTDLDGVKETTPYEVLGRDRTSVVIRDLETRPLTPTEFDVIFFDGPDSYWVYAKLGGIQEYFKRVR
jgi:hypothetical protein